MKEGSGNGQVIMSFPVWRLVSGVQTAVQTSKKVFRVVLEVSGLQRHVTARRLRLHVCSSTTSVTSATQRHLQHSRSEASEPNFCSRAQTTATSTSSNERNADSSFSSFNSLTTTYLLPPLTPFLQVFFPYSSFSTTSLPFISSSSHSSSKPLCSISLRS